MKRSLEHWKLILLVAALAVCWSCLSTPAVAQATKAKAPAESATKPVPRNGPRDKSWMDRHLKMNERVKQGHVDLVFIGDSITHGWEGKGKEVWKEYYGNRNAVNLGIGGDRTQHVLWRLQNGNLDGISPKLAVLMIGTNNSGGNTPEEIAAGVTAIVKELHARVPKTKVLLLAIFPRGADNDDPKRKVNVQANTLVAAQVAGDPLVQFLDIGSKFLAADGTLPKEVMADRLHPGAAGYKTWAEAIEPIVLKEVGPK
jgi:beta-glucosidase